MHGPAHQQDCGSSIRYQNPLGYDAKLAKGGDCHLSGSGCAVSMSGFVTRESSCKLASSAAAAYFIFLLAVGPPDALRCAGHLHL